MRIKTKLRRAFLDCLNGRRAQCCRAFMNEGAEISLTPRRCACREDRSAITQAA
jgi:hypothetical protein